MTLRLEVLLLILACMAVTFIPRVLPMLLFGRVELPQWFLIWLRYIPVAIISALFFKDTLLLQGQLRSWDDVYLTAGLLTLLIAFVSRNIFVTIIGGAVVFNVLRWVLAT